MQFQKFNPIRDPLWGLECGKLKKPGFWGQPTNQQLTTTFRDKYTFTAHAIANIA